MHIYLAMGIGGGRGSDRDAWSLDMTDEVSGFVRNWRLDVRGIGVWREEWRRNSDIPWPADGAAAAV